ncbi:hypothetical protein CE91St66_21380 [[Clostridium] symbiosum]|nr:hypothetical protein CE91St66_21380 [[Clostridium] symbiosum]
MTIQIVKLIMSSINPLACHLKIPEKYGADRRIGGEDYEKKITEFRPCGGYGRIPDCLRKLRRFCRDESSGWRD